MKNRQYFNLDWYFKTGFSKSDVKKINLKKMEKVNLPHSVKTLPYNCFSHDETCIDSTYAKVYAVDDLKKRYVLEFEGVMCYFDLYINEKLVGSHSGGYSRSRFEISKYLKQGDNTLVMKVDSHERDDIPPFGLVIDYLTFGGIYRNVNLYCLEESYLEEMFVRYDIKDKEVILHPEFYVDSLKEEKGVIEYEILDDGEKVFSYKENVNIKKGKSSICLKNKAIKGLKLWNPDKPKLYTVKAYLKQNGKSVDEIEYRVGFRTVEAKIDGLYVNGKKHKLIGINRHQSYPYIGYAMSKRGQQSDVDLLKKWGFNAIRTSHYMQSRYFLDRCDELGILVFEEIPGWQYLGGKQFKLNCLNDVKMMVINDFNHPSIFMWGVRINESLDDDELYTKTNKIAHDLDSSRPTGGVRYLQGSSLLEDVYCYNDFCHADDPGLENIQLAQRTVTKLDHDVPYLVTEYMGHTYPTKQFDNEKRLDEHTRRHARILGRTFERDDAMGSFGWCAFDYNTHGDFGAGDKICYHGIFDMFRIPKYAAYVYRSQKDVKDEIVLQPITNFSRGEKDLDGINPFLVATNCDCIEVYMYGQSVGKYYPSDKFYGLKHPLIEVTFDDKKFWNVPWQDGKIVGYVNNKKVAEYKYARDPYLKSLEVIQETKEISNSEVDTCRFECSFLDNLGHPCLFYNGIINVETTGDIEVIGPKTISVVGGRIAFWVKSKANGKQGKATITIKALETKIKDQKFEINLK